MFTSMGLEAAEEIEIDIYFASKIENQFSIDRIMQLDVTSWLCRYDKHTWDKIP